MLAVPEAEHVNVRNPDPAAGRRNVARRGVEDALVRAGEGAFLNGHVVDDMNAVHVQVRVRKRVSAAIERQAGGLSRAAHPARRLEDDIICEHLRKPVEIVGVKSFRSSLECFAHGHRHWISLCCRRAAHLARRS